VTTELGSAAGRPVLVESAAAVAALEPVVRRHLAVLSARGEDPPLELVRWLDRAEVLAALRELGSASGPCAVRVGPIPGRWVSTDGASEVLGVAPRTVRKLAASGRLPGAERHGRDWSIPEAALAAHMARRSAA
jgi:excisionase family DNA binding protein